MKIAVTGVSGRLGSALAEGLGTRFEVLGLDRAALELADPDGIPARLAEHRFEVLIHPAALTSPDAAEDDPELAERVNAEAPGVLAAECRRRGARMIQISTDYVFGGEAPGMRAEDDPTAPAGVYGRSKLAGERAVLAAFPGACVARVCWLYGPGRPGFPEQVIERARRGERLELIDDKFSLPTWVPDLVDWIRVLVERPELAGVVHAAPSGEPASWYDWGMAALEEAVACGLLEAMPELGRNSLEGCGLFRAPRPRHTAMANGRLAGILGAPPADWREALRRHLRGIRESQG